MRDCLWRACLERVRSLPPSVVQSCGCPRESEVDRLQACVRLRVGKRTCRARARRWRSADTIPSLTDWGTSTPHQGGRRPPGIASETKATRGSSEAPGVFQRPGVGAGAPAPVLGPPCTRKGRSAQHSASHQSAVTVDPPGSCRRIPKGFQRVLPQNLCR